MGMRILFICNNDFLVIFILAPVQRRLGQQVRGHRRGDEQEQHHRDLVQAHPFLGS